MISNLSIQSTSRKVFTLILMVYLSTSLFLQLTLIQNALLLGIPLLILALILFFKKLLSGFKLYKFLNPAYLYLIFLPIPAIIGFLNKNNHTYLIGDLWQVVFILLILFFVIELTKDKKDIERLFKFVILFCSLDIIVYFVRIGISGYFRTYSLSSMILAIICFYLLIYSKRRNGRVCGIFLLVSLIHLILTQTRTYWLGAIFGILIIILSNNLRKLLKPKIIGIFVLTVLLLAGYSFIIPKTRLANTEFDPTYVITHRIDSLRAEKFITGGSFKGRIMEAKEIVSEYKDFPILNKLVGAGFGSIYESPRREYKPTASVHHIHVTYADILFYQGIIGLILFLWFIIYTLFIAWKNKKSKSEIVDIDINKLSVILILVFLFISLGANYIWANMIFSLLIGIIYAYRKLILEESNVKFNHS